MSSFEPENQQKQPTSTVQKPHPGPHPFKGIYDFGKNGSALANNQYLAGTYLGFYWSELESVQGQFNWQAVDNAMKPWISNGKKIILRVSTAGWKSWQPPFSQQGTPQWVYDMGVSFVTEQDKSVKPQYWNQHFLDALNQFVLALAARYDGNAHITAIEMGVGDGGETKPDTRNNPQRLQMWQKIGYTDPLWWDTIQKIVGLYQGAFKHTPLALMPDNTFLGKTAGYDEHKVVNWAIAQQPPLWLQNNGVIAGQKPDPVWLKTMIIAEQRQKTRQSGDTLAQDLQLMLDYGASYALCFEADLADPKNQATLQEYAALVQS
jgi:hypothetical protein